MDWSTIPSNNPVHNGIPGIQTTGSQTNWLAELVNSLFFVLIFVCNYSIYVYIYILINIYIYTHVYLFLHTCIYLYTMYIVLSLYNM